MQGIDDQLCEDHGVAIRYESTLDPSALYGVLSLYGKVSSASTYVLVTGEYFTVAFYAEPAANKLCYTSLRSIITGEERGPIQDVGWANENSEASLARRPYVQRKWVAPSAASEADGFLVVFLKKVPDEQRLSVTQQANSSAKEVFADDREGGRLFMRFSTDDEAEDFRRALVASFPSLAREVSYSDARAFLLARENLPSSTPPST